MNSNGPETNFAYMCTVTLTLEIWLWLRSWYTLGSWKQLCEISTPKSSKELWPWHNLRICVYCDLDLRDMTIFVYWSIKINCINRDIQKLTRVHVARFTSATSNEILPKKCSTDANQYDISTFSLKIYPFSWNSNIGLAHLLSIGYTSLRDITWYWWCHTNIYL